MITDPTIQFNAGYYSYLAGTASFPPFRPHGWYTPEDWHNPPDDNPELARALRCQDWYTLGMIAARSQTEQTVPYTQLTHAGHVALAAGPSEPSPIRLRQTPAEQRHFDQVKRWWA